MPHGCLTGYGGPMAPRRVTGWLVVALWATAACILTSEDAREFRCSADNQCDPRWTCLEGVCRRRCTSVTGCFVGQDCVGGACRPVAVPGSSSTGGSTSAQSGSAGSGSAAGSASSTAASSGASLSPSSSSTPTTSSSRGPVYSRNLIYVGGGGGAARDTRHFMQTVIPAGPAASPSPRMSVGPLTTVESR